MRTVKLILEYDGTNYVGWQSQPNGPTVQDALELAIKKLTGETLRVTAASRTDAGVHARGQVVALRTINTIPITRFALALNSRLPEDICVRSAEEIDPAFNPRRNVTRKLYRYTIINSPLRPALERNFVWPVKQPLDTGSMVRAAPMFVGTHDFTSFCKPERTREGADNTRTIDRSELTVQGERLTFEIEGRSFLYNMVRAMVGTLVDVGAGRFAVADIPEIFAARDRSRAGQGAPPQGLCLMWVKYE